MPHTNYRKRAFCYNGALLWDKLPISLRKSDSLGYFKGKLANYMVAPGWAPTR